MEEELINKLKQQDRIEYKLDGLLMEDVYNFLMYTTMFISVVGAFFYVFLLYAKIYDGARVIRSVIIISFVCYLTWASVFRIVRQNKINKKYFKEEIKVRR